MEIVDFAVLVAFLFGISLYGFIKSRQSAKDAREILVGSQISALSVALSVCSGYLSSISLLGFPAEVYFYGGTILWFVVVYFIAFPLTAFVFLPVLHKLNTTSIYEYLERRFGYSCRLVATSLFCVQTLLYNSVALYAPSLALSSLTGIPLIISILLSAVLSAAYISLGGAKTGIHTSAIQMLVIFASMAVLVAIGLQGTSISEVLTIAHNGHRLDLYDLRFDPRVRHSVWSVIIGGTGNVLCLFASNQLSMQKYMVMKDLKEAQRVVLLNIPFNMFILFTYVSMGLLLYQHYANCHPVMTPTNEILPRFVIDALSHIPGIVGLFAAAIYSAGISTLSSSFAALSALIISDVSASLNNRKGSFQITEQHTITAARFLPVIFAGLTIVLAILCSQLKMIILQISFIVFGAGGGPVLGSFIVGLFLRFVRGKAALIGIVSSIIISFVVAIGSTVLRADPVQLPLIKDCHAQNTTIESQLSLPDNFGRVNIKEFYGLENIFQVSYQYYSIIGVLSNVIVSVIVQLFLRDSGDKEETPIELLSPLVRSQGQSARTIEVEAEQRLMDKQKDNVA